MLNFLLALTSSVASSSSLEDSTSISESISENSEAITQVYEIGEALFWYGFLLVIIVIFVCFVKFRSTNKKMFVLMQSKVNKEVNRYDSIINKFNSNGGKGKLNLKEEVAKTPIILGRFEADLVELKEKTRLADFDLLLKLCDQIIDKCKKVTLSKNSPKSTDEIEDIQMDLVKLKGQIELVAPLIK